MSTKSIGERAAVKITDYIEVYRGAKGYQALGVDEIRQVAAKLIDSEISAAGKKSRGEKTDSLDKDSVSESDTRTTAPLSALSDEELRVEVAELCGWAIKDGCLCHNGSKVIPAYGWNMTVLSHANVPNYPRDPQRHARGGEDA